MVPGHVLLKDITEPDLQEPFAWSFSVWMTGRFPRLDHLGQPVTGTRKLLADSNTAICGGFIGVYTSTISDQLWSSQHYRFDQLWSKIDICKDCTAQDSSGHLNFLRAVAFPKRSHAEYMRSPAAQMSPLTRVPGFHLTSPRPEALHAGPLGALPDHAGSALIEMCDQGIFGFEDLGDWQIRLSAQLQTAFSDFCQWSSDFRYSHKIQGFTRHKFSMLKKSSWPMYKGKGGNCVVLCRWLEAKCTEVWRSHPTRYNKLRSVVMWAWVEFWHICGHSADPDWYSAEELRRLQLATDLILHGCKVLGEINFGSAARWKCRPKLHHIWHINDFAQQSHRPVYAFWTFKEEDGMGKLSRIACAVHAARISCRALQRWCVQFFAGDD